MSENEIYMMFLVIDLMYLVVSLFGVFVCARGLLLPYILIRELEKRLKVVILNNLGITKEMKSPASVLQVSAKDDCKGVKFDNDLSKIELNGLKGQIITSDFFLVPLKS